MLNDSISGILSRAYNPANGLGDDSTGLAANATETMSVAIKNYNRSKYYAIAKENGLGQSYEWFNSKDLENSQLWGYSGGIAESASKLGKATPYITVACDVVSDVKNGEKSSKVIADATVDTVVYVGSAFISDIAVSATVGAVGGPVGMLAGAVVGLGIGIVTSLAMDGISIGKDEKGNDVSIKQAAEKKLSEGIDNAFNKIY